MEKSDGFTGGEKGAGKQAASETNSTTTGNAAQAASSGRFGQLPPEMAERVARVRSQLREAFGTVALAMMLLPRYRHQSLADLQHLLLEPLLHDRVAIARRAPVEAEQDSGREGEQAGMPPLQSDIAGIAIWASVSKEVDARIREQIRARVFPVRLKPGDWKSGDINWLFDVIAPDRRTATSIVANLKRALKNGDLRLHPILGELLDRDTLEKLVRKPAGFEASGDGDK